MNIFAPSFPAPVALQQGSALNCQTEKAESIASTPSTETGHLSWKLRSKNTSSSAAGSTLVGSAASSRASSRFRAPPNPWRAYRTQKRYRKQLYSVFKQERSIAAEFPEGFPQLAAFMNSDESFAMFRRFGQTSCRVLLHLQADVANLERELAELDKSDANDPEKEYRLRTSEHAEGWDTTQRDIVQRLQEKLAIYYDLMLKDKQIRALGNPIDRDHKSVFHWVSRVRPLTATDEEWILHKEDLVPLGEIHHFQSSLTCWSKTYIKYLFSTPNEDSPDITYYSQSLIASVARLISVLTSVGLLIIPVFLLFWAQLTRGLMLATVLISVLIFASLLSLFTKTKIQEVFVGTAAYCAVLATFLGNVQGGVALASA